MLGPLGADLGRVRSSLTLEEDLDEPMDLGEGRASGMQEGGLEDGEIATELHAHDNDENTGPGDTSYVHPTLRTANTTLNKLHSQISRLTKANQEATRAHSRSTSERLEAEKAATNAYRVRETKLHAEIVQLGQEKARRVSVQLTSTRNVLAERRAAIAKADKLEKRIWNSRRKF